MILLMKMKDHVEDDLELPKEKGRRSTRVIKYSFISFFPDQVD
jgi:hypothetical protein